MLPIRGKEGVPHATLNNWMEEWESQPQERNSMENNVKVLTYWIPFMYSANTPTLCFNHALIPLLCSNQSIIVIPVDLVRHNHHP